MISVMASCGVDTTNVADTAPDHGDGATPGGASVCPNVRVRAMMRTFEFTVIGPAYAMAPGAIAPPDARGSVPFSV
jgi:hypothetical protein